jgi:isopentenyl diphosphate isomerase/L-lactate dehydrogenase-like FMN-dependent dehydrogenase
VAGAEGVQQVFEILRSELEVAMRFNGLASVADVDSSLIFRP